MRRMYSENQIKKIASEAGEKLYCHSVVLYGKSQYAKEIYLNIYNKNKNMITLNTLKEQIPLNYSNIPCCVLLNTNKKAIAIYMSFLIGPSNNIVLIHTQLPADEENQESFTITFINDDVIEI